MAATAGSSYQAILLKHIANNPPNAYPQTAFETFPQYKNRMGSQGLPVDIYADEEDTAYETRLASYVPAPTIVALSAVTATSATTAVTATSASFATTSSFGQHARSGETATSSSYALSSSFAP